MSLRILLFASLALNVLAVGAIVGFFAGGGFQGEPAQQAGATLAAPRAVMAALPPDVRRVVRRDLVRAWIGAREERAALRAANADVTRLMTADPYDVAAMREALRRQRAAGEALVARFHEAIADDWMRLTPDQRRAAADALQASRRGRMQQILDEPRPPLDEAP